MIEVFITNIKNKTVSENVKVELLKIDSNLKISFDHEDVDNVLRVEGAKFNPQKIIKVVNRYGFLCEIMS